MKAYCVYQESAWAEDIHAMLVREDGAVLAEHLCSNPAYVYGDLWGTRAERRARYPDLKVEEKPMYWKNFQAEHPDVFSKAFYDESLK